MWGLNLGGVRKANNSDATVAGYVFWVTKLPSFKKFVFPRPRDGVPQLPCPDAAAAVSGALLLTPGIAGSGSQRHSELCSADGWLCARSAA